VSRDERIAQLLREIHRRLLRRLRDESPKRLTQRELAERISLSRDHVVALESGRRGLTESTLARYLAAHDLAPSAFFVAAARLAEELEGSLPREDKAAQDEAAGERTAVGGATVLWQRETRDERLVLMQLPRSRPIPSSPRSGRTGGGPAVPAGKGIDTD
jgi:transcriptional regulator with XRE-family HTH domain